MSLAQGWANFRWKGRITGLWIIKGSNILKSKKFSLDSSASVYFFRGSVRQAARGPQFAHSCSS